MTFAMERLGVFAFIVACIQSQGFHASAVEWKGSSSCASATCHGGTVGRGPAWNDSYSLSRSADPHSTSGALLYDADSRRIVAAISPGATDDLAYDIVLRERCISCHLTTKPEDIVSKLKLDLARVGEGISCESCHGQASDWLGPHVLASWTGPMRFEPHTGMLDTESLISRAEGCVRCHVGSRTADGMVRDMNHDLIAAGHPALRFDLLIYSDNMPHHWNDLGDVEQKFSGSAIRVRDVGRLVALSAAARLSAERATASLAKPSSGSLSHAIVPWPELSDFDCFGCHQSLLPRSYRLPSNVDGKPSLQISSGLPLWNAWYTSDMATGSDPQMLPFRLKPGGQQDWIAAANKIADLVSKRAQDAASAPTTDASARMVELRTKLNQRAPSDWNAAAAIYLQMEAAARNLAAQPATHSLGVNLARSLETNVATLLRFSDHEGKDDSRVRSPDHFDPTVFRTRMIEALDSLDETPP